MIEEIAGQPGPLAEMMLGEQITLTNFVSRQIKRMPLAQTTEQSLCRHEFNKSVRRSYAAPIDARCSFRSVNIRELGQRAIDFPQQHGGACKRAAMAGPLAINDADVVSLRCEMLRRQ